MVLWQESGYTRTDPRTGEPVSFVRCLGQSPGRAEAYVVGLQGNLQRANSAIQMVSVDEQV